MVPLAVEVLIRLSLGSTLFCVCLRWPHNATMAPTTIKPFLYVVPEDDTPDKPVTTADARKLAHDFFTELKQARRNADEEDGGELSITDDVTRRGWLPNALRTFLSYIKKVDVQQLIAKGDIVFLFLPQIQSLELADEGVVISRAIPLQEDVICSNADIRGYTNNEDVQAGQAHNDEIDEGLEEEFAETQEY